MNDIKGRSQVRLSLKGKVYEYKGRKYILVNVYEEDILLSLASAIIFFAFAWLFLISFLC